MLDSRKERRTWIVGRGLRLSYDGSALKLVDEAWDNRLRNDEAKR